MMKGLKMIKCFKLLFLAVGVIMFLYPSTTFAAEQKEYGDYLYIVDDADNICIVGYQGLGGDIKLPSRIEGKAVTRIGSESFRNCTTISSIEIPDGVISIEEMAFAYCSNLESIIIPDSVQFIQQYVFFHCEKLTSVNLPVNLSMLSTGMFSNCYKLSSVVIPYVNSNRYNVFEKCTNLEVLIFPDLYYLETSLSDIPATTTQVKYKRDNNGGVTIISIALGEGVTSVNLPDSIINKEYVISDEAKKDIGNTKIVHKKHCGGTATCRKKAVCSVCGEPYGKMLNHTYDAGKVTKAATCVKEGTKVYTCKSCGGKKTEIIKATGKHKWNAGKVTKKSTISRKGMKVYKCLGCKKTKKVIIPTTTKLKSVKLKAKKKSLTLSWKKVRGAKGYEIQYSTKSSFKSSKRKCISGSKTSTSIKKLKGKKKYYVRIRAYKTYKEPNGKLVKMYSKWMKLSATTK